MKYQDYFISFTANERMVETIGSVAEKVPKGGKIFNGIGNQRVYL